MIENIRFPREEKAVRIFKERYEGITVHEDEKSGYYVDNPPDDYRLARNIYDLVDIRSGYNSFIKVESTRPFLFKRKDRYYIVVLSRYFSEWEQMILRQSIYV